jgi:hypothetical protein
MIVVQLAVEANVSNANVKARSAGRNYKRTDEATVA